MNWGMKENRSWHSFLNDNQSFTICQRTVEFRRRVGKDRGTKVPATHVSLKENWVGLAASWAWGGCRLWAQGKEEGMKKQCLPLQDTNNYRLDVKYQDTQSTTFDEETESIKNDLWNKISFVNLTLTIASYINKSMHIATGPELCPLRLSSCKTESRWLPPGRELLNMRRCQGQQAMALDLIFSWRNHKCRHLQRGERLCVEQGQAGRRVKQRQMCSHAWGSPEWLGSQPALLLRGRSPVNSSLTWSVFTLLTLFRRLPLASSQMRERSGCFNLERTQQNLWFLRVILGSKS